MGDLQTTSKLDLPATTGTARFAVDTGGTFTDLIIAWPGNRMTMYKAPTTPDDPSRGILDCFRAAASAHEMSLVELLLSGNLLVHGTTHAINAIMTNTTARTAFLTTAGHPDTLVIREGGRTEPFNFTVAYPEPYIPKALTFEIDERILADGSIYRPLAEADLAAVLDHVEKANVEAIAVCLLWSVINPAHELLVGEMIAERFPDIPFSLSHRTNPSIREYRRAMSTCIDASLRPIVSTYMSSLDHKLRQEGFAGQLFIGTSLGGVIKAEEAADNAVKLINSGPSMAPVAARAYCQHERAIIIGAAGGTTFDVSLVRDGRIPRTRENWLGAPYLSHVTGMPSVDVKSVGAGGGSIAWCDDAGLLHVGPQSAGSVPGPVCYSKGGKQPTVTDAAVVLGLIDPLFFLNGEMHLDRDAAAKAIEAQIAPMIGKSVEEASEAIIALSTEHMVQAILGITVNQGVDPTGSIFVAGGGAAGINGVRIAKRLGCSRVAFPETGAALSATGAVISELSSYFQSVQYLRSDSFNINALSGTFAILESAASEFFGGPPNLDEGDQLIWSVEARYPDQAWEIEVPLRSGKVENAKDVERLEADFHDAHETLFATKDTGSPIEIIAWNLEVRRPVGDTSPGRLAKQKAVDHGTHRRIWSSDHGWQQARIIVPGHDSAPEKFEGPAVIESGFTSIVVDPGFHAFFDPMGTLIVDCQTASKGTANVE